MKRILPLILIAFCLNFNNVFAKELSKVEITPVKIENKSTPETPQALLNDENYKIKGKIEYNEDTELFLDTEDIDKINLKIGDTKKRLPKAILNENILTDIQNTNTPHKINLDEKCQTLLFNSLDYKLNDKLTYGTTFSTDVDIAQFEYRTKLFLKYDNKKFGMLTGIGKDQYTTSGNQLESIYIIPEFKLGHGFVIKDAFKSNPFADKHRNDIILQYNPKIGQTRENVQLEAGLSHLYYYQTGSQIYQLSISTKFRL